MEGCEPHLPERNMEGFFAVNVLAVNTGMFTKEMLSKFVKYSISVLTCKFWPSKKRKKKICHETDSKIHRFTFMYICVFIFNRACIPKCV